MLESQGHILVAIHPFRSATPTLTALLNRTVLGDACMRLTVVLLPEPCSLGKSADGDMNLARRFAESKNK